MDDDILRGLTINLLYSLINRALISNLLHGEVNNH